MEKLKPLTHCWWENTGEQMLWKSGSWKMLQLFHSICTQEKWKHVSHNDLYRNLHSSIIEEPKSANNPSVH